jgi:hypothetical protein
MADRAGSVLVEAGRGSKRRVTGSWLPRLRRLCGSRSADWRDQPPGAALYLTGPDAGAMLLFFDLDAFK